MSTRPTPSSSAHLRRYTGEPVSAKERLATDVAAPRARSPARTGTLASPPLPAPRCVASLHGHAPTRLPAALHYALLYSAANETETDRLACWLTPHLAQVRYRRTSYRSELTHRLCTLAWHLLLLSLSLVSFGSLVSRSSIDVPPAPVPVCLIWALSSPCALLIILQP